MIHFATDMSCLTITTKKGYKIRHDSLNITLLGNDCGHKSKTTCTV